MNKSTAKRREKKTFVACAQRHYSLSLSFILSSMSSLKSHLTLLSIDCGCVSLFSRCAGRRCPVRVKRWR